MRAFLPCLAVLLALPSTLAAQDAAAVATVRTLSACITEHETHLSRLVRLIAEAETRTSSSDEAVRHDAIESITALVGRAHDVHEHLRECLTAAHIPRPEHTTVEHVTTVDHAADSVAGTGGSIHEVEADVDLAAHVHVVRGERVDGSGTATDSAVVRAVHALSGGLETCYDAYVDRVGARSGAVHLSFTIGEGGALSTATVERTGFDTPLRQCVERSARTLHVEGARGRSVFAYELRLGE